MRCDGEGSFSGMAVYWNPLAFRLGDDWLACEVDREILKGNLLEAFRDPNAASSMCDIVPLTLTSLMAMQTRHS